MLETSGSQHKLVVLIVWRVRLGYPEEMINGSTVQFKCEIGFGEDAITDVSCQNAEDIDRTPYRENVMVVATE